MRVIFAALICCSFVATTWAQLPDGTSIPSASDTADARMKFMVASGKSYQVTVDGQSAKLHEKALLRFTNDVSGLPDGALFVWQDQSKRPVAAAQFFIAPGTERLWIHEFQSLAGSKMKFTFDGRDVWTPSKPGVTFTPIAKAPAPAKTPTARLVQMRQLARRFSISDDFEGAEPDQLRLMTTPLVRYQDEKTTDGAMFAFCHGTDPELFVLLEARDSKWHVGLAPMTAYAMTAKLDDEAIWQVEWRQAPHAKNAIFMNFAYPPEAPATGTGGSLFEKFFGN